MTKHEAAVERTVDRKHYRKRNSNKPQRPLASDEAADEPLVNPNRDRRRRGA